jgi:site-specific DNA-methyltransferase (adenine-specific)
MNEVIHGECIGVMRGMDDESIDLTVTSPPYDNLRAYKGYDFDFEGIADELFRITKQGGVIVWVVGDATVKGSETGTSFRQALYFKEIGFNLHDTMIWNKGTFTAVGSLKTRYAPVFEYMFVFSKGKLKTFNPLKDRPNKSFGMKHSGNIRQRDGSSKPLANIGKVIPEYGQRFNIWDCSASGRNKSYGHPAVFPEQLAKDHIISWSNEGDVVFDPMCGSGTTLLMAKETNRQYIGIDIAEEYVELSRNRLEKLV